MKELSDKNRPKKLEDIFREGMKEAEVAPSDLLWSRIERDLNIKETGYYKERLVWYQRLAAACVALVLCAGAYIFFENQENISALTAPAGIAQVPETAVPTPAPGSRPAKLEKAPQRAHTAALSPSAETIVEQTVTKANRQGIRNLSEKHQPGASDIYSGGDLAAGANTQALAQAEQINRPDPDAPTPGKIKAFLPASAATSLLARTRQPLTRLPQTGISPDSLAPVLTWPALDRLAALGAAEPASRFSVAAAALPAHESAADKENAGSRWRFGGNYASQYFDQNIALAHQQTGLASNAVVPSAMLPLASNAGTTSYADALQEFDRKTASGFSFNTGISAAYQVSEHLDLETGLRYTQNVATTNTSYVFSNARISSRSLADFGSGPEVNKTALVANGIPATAFLATLAGGASLDQTAITKTQGFDTHYRYRLLGIPIKVSYQTSRGKSFYFASMGMLTNLLVQANILSDSDRVPDLQYAPHAEESPFRGWQFAAVASAGKGFGIGPGLQIRAGLEATQYLSHLTHPHDMGGKQRKPYTIGLALSSSYTFGR